MTIDNIHTLLHPTFRMAVRDGIIRVNPAEGVMAEIKRSNSWDKGTRHALTREQQKHLWNIQQIVRYIVIGYHYLQFYLERDVESGK